MLSSYIQQVKYHIPFKLPLENSNDASQPVGFLPHVSTKIYRLLKGVFACFRLMTVIFMKQPLRKSTCFVSSPVAGQVESAVLAVSRRILPDPG